MQALGGYGAGQALIHGAYDEDVVIIRFQRGRATECRHADLCSL
jgi:hypothetical protein